MSIVRVNHFELGELVNTKVIDACAEAMTNVMHMEDVKAVVSKFNEQDVLISKAKEFSHLRAKYAALEAATYRKIVIKGWGDALGSKRTNIRLASEWLANEPNYEQCIETILNGDGQTLISLWKDNRRQAEVRHRWKDYIKAKHTILEDYDAYGRVLIDRLYTDCDSYEGDLSQEEYLYRLQDYPDERYEEIDTKTEIAFNCKHNHYGLSNEQQLVDKVDEIEDAVTDSTRIALRKRGAVGIGGGKYVDPNRHPEDLSKALDIRKRNICYCIKKLMEICKAVDDANFMTELDEAIRMTKLPLTIVETSPNSAAAIEVRSGE